MSKRRSAAILLLILLATTGCYTQLRQVPAASVYDDPTEWESWYAPPGFSFYDVWTLPYYTSYYGPGAWAWAPYYYYYPWWWDPWRPPGAPGSPAPLETGGRHAWDRGPGAPYIPGIGGTQQPTPSGGGKPSTIPPETKPATDPDPPKPEDPKPDDRKPEDRKPDESPRHGWGR